MKMDDGHVGYIVTAFIIGVLFSNELFGHRTRELRDVADSAIAAVGQYELVATMDHNRVYLFNRQSGSVFKGDFKGDFKPGRWDWQRALSFDELMRLEFAKHNAPTGDEVFEP